MCYIKACTAIFSLEMIFMKKLKRILLLSLILAALVACFALHASAATVVDSGYCGDEGDGTNLSWTLDSEGTLTISGTSKMADYTWVSTPWYSYRSSIRSVAIGDHVTSIGEDAFSYCTSLTNVTIPDSVTSIGGGAFFGCASLTNVTIPDSVTSIDNYAFYSCYSLTSVTIPDSVTTIGGWAFYECTSLTNVTIPDSVTTIGDGAFSFCTSLTNVTIPDSVTTIGDDAFSVCSGLTSVTIPDSVTTIGESPFFSCTSLTKITVDPDNENFASEDGVLFNKQKTKLIQYPGGKTGDYHIPDSVTSIGGSAFYECTSLTNVTIPDSVTTIGGWAFYSCTGLTSVTIPDSVTYIGGYAFYDCTSLTNVTIPDSVTSIGDAAFRECTSLTNVTIPDSVTTIGGWAFSLCTSLTNVTIPDSVTNIGADAFLYCTSLTSVTIGNSVTNIGADAFYGCTRLTDVYFEGNAPAVTAASSSYRSFDETVTLYYIPGTTGWTDSDAYDAATGTWHGYKLATWDGNGNIPTNPLVNKPGYFTYDALYGPTTYGYSYDESWFLGSSTQYNHDLAKMSIRVAMAAYMTGANEGSNIGSGNISKLMKDELGFDNLKVYYPSPTRDTIGYAIGRKPLGETDKTLILVAVRGGAYDAEWASNFTVADSIKDAGYYHAGFSSSAEKVQTALASYINSNQLDANNCIVWITSYSRGAAVSNFLAKLLDDGKIPGLGTNNVFAYCFACPQNSMASDRTDYKYNNIINVVNPLDFVPMVAMSKWGYGRYGQTYYLPYEEGVGRYNTLKNEMIKEYGKILAAGNASDTPYQTTLQVAGQKAVTEGLMDWVADEFRSPLNYYISLYQASLVSVVEAACTKDWGLADWAALYPLAVKLCGISLDISVSSMPHNILNDMLSDQTNMKALLAAELLIAGTIDRGDFRKTPISYTHYPELYLAWMDSLDGDRILSVNSKYRRVLVNCPVNISVYDSNDVLVGSIVDGVVQEIENGISVYIDEDGQFVLCIPNEEEYRVEMEATDDGTVTYTVTEQTLEAPTPDRVVSYPLMEVEAGDTFSGQVEAIAEEDEPAEYTLFFNEEAQEPVELLGEEIENFEITCKVEGNGTVDGEGSAVFGEYKKLTATAGEDDSFLGWYDGNTLLSTEEEYRFCVQEHVWLVAKFTSNTKTGYCGIDELTESLMWQLTQDGTLTIAGFGPMAAYSAENPAPWSIYSSEITEVVIGIGVMDIGENAFAGCTNIQTVHSYAPGEQLYVFPGNDPLMDARWNWISQWGEDNEIILTVDEDQVHVTVRTDTACNAMIYYHDEDFKFLRCEMKALPVGTTEWTTTPSDIDLSSSFIKLSLLEDETGEHPWAPICNAASVFNPKIF